MTFFLYVMIVSVFICDTISAYSFNVISDLKGNYFNENNNKRVCVIGAGIAGLSSARYLKEEGINFTVLEATNYVGGTWRYDPRVGKDENEQPLYTSMYQNLRTNLPKPTMELRGFPLPDNIQSFPSWSVYYEYLQTYAKHFDIEQYIKFLHKVISVRREDNVWKVKHQHVQTKEIFEEEYDYILVGNGHFSKPKMPNIPRENLFKGTIIHSHDYKNPDPFKGRKVMVIGAGPSGMDISIDVSKVCKKMIHSHHSTVNFRTQFVSHHIKKPDVKEFNETGAIFVDGTYEELDDVIYCTGFHFNYPFLDETSELQITPKTVAPLYKHMVNINQPSMVILGLVIRACLVVAIDAQARYAASLVKGNFTLPSREEMLKDWQRQVDVIHSKGQPMSFLHVLAEREDTYYESLSKESGIERVPAVMFKIRVKDMEAKLENLYTYRDYVYTVIDDDNFVRTVEEIPANNTLTR